MTDKEIIKAWDEELHLANYVNENYRNGVKVSLIEDTLDLINRQQAEIEKLKIAKEHLTTFNVEAQAEIERLQKHSKKVLETCSRVTKANDERNNEIFQGAIEVVRAEAIKEFAEGLDRKFAFSSDTQCISAKTIRKFIQDELKEVVGEDK